MQMIIEYARSEGLKTISGDVLVDNTVMLAMCRSLGFDVKADPVEHNMTRHAEYAAPAVNLNSRSRRKKGRMVSLRRTSPDDASPVAQVKIVAR